MRQYPPENHDCHAAHRLSRAGESSNENQRLIFSQAGLALRGEVEFTADKVVPESGGSFWFALVTDVEVAMAAKRNPRRFCRRGL